MIRRLRDDTISPAPPSPVAGLPAPQADRPGAGCTWALACESPQAGDVHRLRREARAVLSGRWGVPADLVDAAELVVCELVGNALRHGAAPVELCLRHGADETVTVTVCDAGGGLPRLRPVDENDESGRGLHLVNALTRWWTVWQHPDGGKTVTAVLASDH